MTIKKFDAEIFEQLALELDVPEESGDGISADEAQRISMTAQRLLDQTWGEDDDAAPTWFDDYKRLVSLGYPWRVAVYIAWESSPKEGRLPKSIVELAKSVLGLTSPRVIYTWRKKNPTIDDAISIMQAAPLFEHRRDVIDAMVSVAKDPDYKGHQDRKMFFEMIGDYVPRSAVEVDDKRKVRDLSELSEEELDAFMGPVMEKLGKKPVNEEIAADDATPDD